jgi:hypothetical protein
VEYLIFAFGFGIFIPFAIWAVSAGRHNSLFDKAELERAELAKADAPTLEK